MQSSNYNTQIACYSGDLSNGLLSVHSLMSYKGFVCNNKSLIQIEDLGRSDIILNISTIITYTTIYHTCYMLQLTQDNRQ